MYIYIKSFRLVSSVRNTLVDHIAFAVSALMTKRKDVTDEGEKYMQMLFTQRKEQIKELLAVFIFIFCKLTLFS